MLLFFKFLKETITFSLNLHRNTLSNIAEPKEQVTRNSDLEVKKEANIITGVKVKKSLIINNS